MHVLLCGLERQALAHNLFSKGYRHETPARPAAKLLALLTEGLDLFPDAGITPAQAIQILSRTIVNVAHNRHPRKAGQAGVGLTRNGKLDLVALLCAQTVGRSMSVGQSGGPLQVTAICGWPHAGRTGPGEGKTTLGGN